MSKKRKKEKSAGENKQGCQKENGFRSIASVQKLLESLRC